MEQDNGVEYSIIVDKERGQVAQSMPHWGLCGIVRLQQLLLQDEAGTKASATSKNKNQDQNRRQFLQEPKQKIVTRIFTIGFQMKYVISRGYNGYIYTDARGKLRFMSFHFASHFSSKLVYSLNSNIIDFFSVACDHTHVWKGALDRSLWVCSFCVNWQSTHHLSTTVSLSVPVSFPLSPSTAVAPQELLGIVDGLGDHVAISEETWRQKRRMRGRRKPKMRNKMIMKKKDIRERGKVLSGGYDEMTMCFSNTQDRDSLCLWTLTYDEKIWER